MEVTSDSGKKRNENVFLVQEKVLDVLGNLQPH
jgi:hypothetical protein